MSRARGSRSRRARRSASRAAGKPIVFTNGVFDLLHLGHVRYLQQARGARRRADGRRQLGSIRPREKGPDRPITPEAERAEWSPRSRASTPS